MEPVRIPNRKRLSAGMLLLVVSGVLGVLAAVQRWVPCWGEPEGLICARLMSGGVAPSQGVFLLGGLADICLLGAVIILLRGRGPRYTLWCLAFFLAVAVVVSLFFGARDAAFGPWADSVLFLIWWWPIPIISFIFIVRMIYSWQSKVETAANAGAEGGPETDTGADREADADMWTVLVMIAILIGTGLSEYVILNVYANSADTPYGFGGLRYALFVLVGLVMSVVLLSQRIRDASWARKNRSTASGSPGHGLQ